MKIRPISNSGDTSSKQKYQRNKKHKQWQRFKRRRSRNIEINKEKFSYDPCRPVMNPSSFWENYANVCKWQKDHFASYWRSRAMSLENEVHKLQHQLSILQNKAHKEIDGRNSQIHNDTNSEVENNKLMDTKTNEAESDKDDDIEECDFKIVVSDEFQEFLNKKLGGGGYSKLG